MQGPSGIGQTRFVALVGMLSIAGSANQAEPTSPAASVATTEPSPVAGSGMAEPWELDESPALLPFLELPGTRADGAGEYGWAGKSASRIGMHRVVEGSQTQITFAIVDDCFAFAPDAEPVPVTLAGLDGLYVEPYQDPEVMFMPPPRTTEVTGAYQLAIGDRTLCVYLTWDAYTTQDELEAARQVVQSIRGQPLGRDGVLINFTLPEGWDTG